MIGVIITLLVALGIMLFAPRLLPEDLQHPLITVPIRLVGLAIAVFGIVSTSYVYVPDGHVGHIFRIYAGGPLTDGRIIARNEENGPQSDILPPGFHFSPLLNVIYDVRTDVEEVVIPTGSVGTLVAKDGGPLRPGQVFADPLPSLDMLNANFFLNNNGQKGPQISILTPGRYRLNRYLWDVTVAKAVEIPAGFVGVVKSNIHAEVDFGPLLQTAKPERCTVIETVRIEGAASENTISAPLVPTGCIGVWKAALQPGKYYLNPTAFDVTLIETRAQVWTYAGGYKKGEISLTVDAKGDVSQQRIDVDVPFDPRTMADVAVFVRMEGWDVPLELRVVAQVAPEDASCLVAGIGGLQEAEDRVISPSIRAIARDVAGGTYEINEARVDATGKPVTDSSGRPIFETVRRPTKVLDLINQRPIIEGEIERRIRPEAHNSCVTIREVRLGEPAIPPELLVAVRREQLATQLSKAFAQEKVAQDVRVTSEKAKATANQQPTLVAAEIGVQASVQNALAAKNIGQGERDRLTLIAEGQKNQMNVLGVEATVGLRKFELLAEKGFTFFSEHPTVLTTALQNAHKFVPNVAVGNGDMGGMLSAIAGQLLQQQDQTGTLIPANRAPGAR